VEAVFEAGYRDTQTVIMTVECPRTEHSTDGQPCDCPIQRADGAVPNL
jgi:hypothetical protein